MRKRDMAAALRLTERNLSSLIAARHPDAVLMSDWREVVRAALGFPALTPKPSL